MPQPKWELKGHAYQIADTGDYDGYYEITNGIVSIYTKDDDESLQQIVDALNESECDFYLDDSHVWEIYSLKEEIERLKTQHSSSGVEGAAVLRQKLNDLIELVTDDKLVLHATPVTGRPHDPNPEISRLRDEIVAEFSAAAPSSKEREMAMGFQEWIEENGYHKNPLAGAYFGYGKKRVANLSALYDLYLESLNKKP